MVKKQEAAKREFVSVAGKESRIKTDIYQTNPRTEIIILGKLPEDVSLELRFVVDTLLKEKGF